jgi:head-tail adaptor
VSLENTLVSISEMDELIGLPLKTQTVDSYGGTLESTAAPSVTEYAKVRFMNMNEGASPVDQEKVTQEIKIWIRFYDGLSYEHQVYWNSKYWDIFSIEPLNKDRFHVIKARTIET